MAQHYNGFNAAADEINPPAVPAADQIEEVKKDLTQEINDHIEGTPGETDLDDATQSE